MKRRFAVEPIVEEGKSRIGNFFRETVVEVKTRVWQLKVAENGGLFR